jgi:hypothetical protein
VFRSFFHAGFECATGWNVHGEWIDQIAATQHDLFVDGDYRLLADVGIRTVREAVRWPLVDCRGRYDFSTLVPMIDAARRHRIEPIWDLFHFGYPPDVDPLGAAFAERFADYCHAAARHLARETEGPWWFTPVNEPSYLAWAAGEAALFAPWRRGCGPELKRRLSAAALRGIEAIRSACPSAGIVNVDAICFVVAPEDRPDLVAEADHFNRCAVFESFDMLAGRLHPELGGTREHLGTVGINYYWTNQWELGGAPRPLDELDQRRLPLRALVRNVWERYGGDVLITETAHVGDHRARWLRHVAGEAEALLDEGVPLRGVCLYPVLGMPEWHARDQWTRMGLWDLVPQSPELARCPHAPALEALAHARHLERRQKTLAPAV